MAFDWTSLIQPILQAGSSLFGNSGSNGTATTQTSGGSPFNWNNIFGAGALAASRLGQDNPQINPGAMEEASQYLRNRLSPQGIPSQFQGTLESLYPTFEPFLQQQTDKDINAISQRYAAAFPGTAGAQGPEFGALANYITDQAEPRRQAFLGDLAFRSLGLGQTAANSLLNFYKPDPLSDALGKLGGSFISSGNTGGLDSIIRQLTGQGTGTAGLPGGATSAATIARAIESYIAGGAGGSGMTFTSGGGGLPGLASAIENYIAGNGGAAFFGSNGAGMPGLANAIESYVAGGGGLAFSSGNAGIPGLATAIENYVAGGAGTGAAGAGTGTAAGTTTGAGGGFSLSGLFSGLASLAGGGLAGYGIGGLLPGQGLASGLAGGAGGALAGVAISAGITALGMTGIGLPFAALLGGLAGAGGGVFGSHNAEVARDAAIHAVDLQAANTNAGNVASFWAQALGSAGVNTADFYAYAKAAAPGDVDKVSADGAGRLLEAYNASRPPAERVSSPDAIPGLRQSFIDYILQNNRIEVGGKLVAPGDIAQQAQLLAAAGFKVEGNPGTLAVAGEDTGDQVSQYFRNPDQPSSAEADELWGKVVARKPGASKPGDWYNMPGAIMNQRAAQLIRGY